MMGSAMEECVLDFDIDLFQQVPKLDAEKAHKSVRVLKNKVTSTNSLLKKYYNKGVICKTLENYLLATKESYKQVCIERMEFREKCTALEEDIKREQDANKELQEKCIVANNKCDGIQSHSKQLALLVKENETTIDSLKIENQLEKCAVKDVEKKCAALQKENDHLIKNIRSLRDIVLGKKTATKEIKTFLNKYGKPKKGTREPNSCDEADGFDDCLSPLSDSADFKQVPASPAGDKNAVKLQNTNIIPENTADDNDSESSNEVVSTDTGRGSSLAFSDSDKCSLLSPDYFIQNSPLGSEVIRSKDKMVVSIATSPILARELTSVATSPIMFKDHELSEPMHTDDSDKSRMNSSPEKIQFNRCIPAIMIDRVVSPIYATEYADMSTSTDTNMNCDAGTSPPKPDHGTVEFNADSVEDHISQEQECLDINNSNNLADENSSDCEIQMILDTMRLHQKLLTPIPTTPAKPRVVAATNIATQTILHAGNVCPDVAKVREENIALQATVAKLAQDIMNINNFLNKCGQSIVNGNAENGDAQTTVSDKYSMELNKKIDQENEEYEVITPVAQNTESIDTWETKKPLSFKSKLSKLKELFDDSSLPSPSDALPPVESCESVPEPRPPSPPPSSPPLSPQSLVIDVDDNISNNNDDIENKSYKSKDRLDFEDPLSNAEFISDNASDGDLDICYEHEIVVELTPDSQESDRQSLHEILMEQQSKSDEEQLTCTRRAKKLTKLEKLRKNMAPKSKIQNTKLRKGNTKTKLRVQPKRLTANKLRILSTECVSPDAAFEKARKIMAEIRSKEKVTNDPVVETSCMPEKNPRKPVEGDLRPSENTENNADQHRNESIIPIDDGRPKQKSPDTGIDFDRADRQRTGNKKTLKNTLGLENTDKQRNKKAIKTPKRLQGKKLSAPAPKRPVRTRSHSKCIDGIDDNDSEVNHINTNHLTSPSLKSYVRNKTVKKEEFNPINNNTLAKGFVQPDAVITEEKQIEEIQPENRKRLKRPSVDKPDIVPKRILRSSSVQPAQTEEENQTVPEIPAETVQPQPINKEIVSYDDLDLFDNNEVSNKQVQVHEPAIPNIERVSSKPTTESQKLGILCTFIDKYGTKYIKRAPKISENMTDVVCKQLEDSIADIQKLPPKDIKQGMDKLVKDLQSSLPNHVLTGLIKFLKEPARKIESYNKINVPPAPPMTKVEQILIYIVAQLKAVWPEYKIVDNILNYIEYTLFMLNRTPEFDVIENLSHFYAILCRYDKNRNRLRLFIIDAMYCLQYKAVPLIRQCLDVWMHILPLAHLGIAKNPLVTCLVYLLHFYKCEDRFNRVQEIRNILRRKYFYEVTEWNETGILEMFRNSIMELRDNANEKKMLRMALIILAKRNGAKWCQNHLVKNMLLPIADTAGVPDRVKHFCVALLGPLLKPYPMEMKVNCEVVINQLFDMLKRKPTPQMEEAIFTSLIYMSRHNQHRVIKALLHWAPERVSPDLEELIKNYVKERPIKSWKQVISKIYGQN